MSQTEYPWHRCVPGTSFFIPSLDPQRTKVEGLGEGFRILGHRAKIDARPGMYRGVLGVMFSVRSAAPRRSTA